MEKLRSHYTGTSDSSLLSDRFKFWTSSQTQHESIQEWEVKVRQAGSLCGYGQLSDKLCRDKFIFGLNGEHMRTELLKTHVKPDKSAKALSDVVAEARAIESATQANQLIAGSAKSAEEEVHSLRHSQMKLRREPGTCFWCGDRRGPHPWKACPANGRSCSSCEGNDHFARVCLENRKAQVPTTNNSWKRQTRGRQSTSYRGSNQRTRGGKPRSKSRDIHYTDSNVAQLQEQNYGWPMILSMVYSMR